MIWKNSFVLLETLRRDKDNYRNFLFSNPADIITCASPAEIEKCLQKMEAYRQKGSYLAGFFSYELGYFLDDSLAKYSPKINYPLLWFGVFDQPREPKSAALEKTHGDYYLTEPTLAASFASYQGKIRKIKNCIARGETYQINYTTHYDFDFFGDVVSFYNNLKAQQKVSYAALMNYNSDQFIISISPELFFRIDDRKNIMVKPMKGTAPLGTPKRWLKQDVKNTSENVMIVDLLRNDLGRICLPGSVKVKKLFAVENYATLLQMTSTVTGKLKPDLGISAIIKSLFPCGSVTGAPKIQSMKIIRQTEDSPRNVYTGAIGYFAPDGQAAFNVAIRTIELSKQPNGKYRAQMGIGSGIVYDSKPKEEYRECQLKAKFLLNVRPEFALIETMLGAGGKIKRLSSHLRRLKNSADFFSIPCSPSSVKTALQAYCAKLTGNTRLRLLCNASGKFTISHHPIVVPAGKTPIIAVSEHRTHSENIFLRHKTTHRKLYDSEFGRYSALGYFDVIFCNERGEVTEGAISNIFIQVKNRFYTPPLSCGLLPGVFRKAMIKKLKAKEKIIYLEDLKKSDNIILTNSVRGATKVTLK